MSDRESNRKSYLSRTAVEMQRKFDIELREMGRKMRLCEQCLCARCRTRRWNDFCCEQHNIKCPVYDTEQDCPDFVMDKEDEE